MLRGICKDQVFLSQKMEPAPPDDLPVAEDLLETLEHHKAGCVGMAANMIGENKRIIAFDNARYLHGHVQSRNRKAVRALSARGGLSLPHRHPPGQAVEIH